MLISVDVADSEDIYLMEDHVLCCGDGNCTLILMTSGKTPEVGSLHDKEANKTLRRSKPVSPWRARFPGRIMPNFATYPLRAIRPEPG